MHQRAGRWLLACLSACVLGLPLAARADALWEAVVEQHATIARFAPSRITQAYTVQENGQPPVAFTVTKTLVDWKDGKPVYRTDSPDELSGERQRAKAFDPTTQLARFQDRLYKPDAKVSRQDGITLNGATATRLEAQATPVTARVLVDPSSGALYRSELHVSLPLLGRASITRHFAGADQGPRLPHSGWIDMRFRRTLDTIHLTVAETYAGWVPVPRP
ncbi:MAG: hypothetical protein ACKO6D_09985 [Rubrivivax sp.]